MDKIFIYHFDLFCLKLADAPTPLPAAFFLFVFIADLIELFLLFTYCCPWKILFPVSRIGKLFGGF